jgi:predicted acylesterase/phospholipase RssA
MLLLALSYAGDRKCRALAMSGGGDKGSYQASVFIEFTNLLSKEDVAYDVITGASAGSLNGAALSLFARGREDEAAEFIFGLWNSISNDDILKNWSEGILYSIFFKSSIFDNSPLVEFLYEQIGPRSFEKKFSVVITNADTGKGEHVDFNASDRIPDDAIPTIVASSSIPFAFPPLYRDDNFYIDGGCVWNLDISGAIRRCKEVVENDEDIILDIILCSSYNLTEPGELKKFKPLDHFIRAQEIMEWHSLMADLDNQMDFYPAVNYRYILGPSVQLSNSPLPLDFSPEHLEFCFDIGKQDARKAIALGEGGYLNAMMDHYKRVQDGERLLLKDVLAEKLQNQQTASEETRR